MEKVQLYTFTLVLSLVFPFLGYSFTTFDFSQDIADYDITVDAELLSKAGITLTNAESHNITFGAFRTEYGLINTTVRARWYHSNLEGDIMAFRKQNPLEVHTNTWFWDLIIEVYNDDIGYKKHWLYNSTMINAFDSDYNWSMFRMSLEGIYIFITIPVNSTGYLTQNMTQAVNVEGFVTVTLGEPMRSEGTFGFIKFAQWYFGLMLGTASYGLPDFMSWIARVIAAIQILSAILLARELIGFT
jgi:hypothetical protein